VWQVSPSQKNLINKIQNGTATLANLTAGGGVQLGLAMGDLAAAGCQDTGNGCLDVYAVSIPGTTPAAFITWFQAAAAARNALKRLPTNQEWQVAALGTPDTGGSDNGTTTCNTDNLAPGVALSGSRAACISDIGAFDMVGNVWEWVGDWGDLGNSYTAWFPTFGNDISCVGGPGPSNLPSAWFRGGSRQSFADAGVFAVNARNIPAFKGSEVGFRCVR
jgi:formylglycine-generating enzyme required for sulfatase activity